MLFRSPKPPCRWFLSYRVLRPDSPDWRYNETITDMHPLKWIRERRMEYPNYAYSVVFFADITGHDIG